MKITAKVILFTYFILSTATVYAKPPTLEKLHPNNLGFSNPKGYEIMLDQVFKFYGSAFEGMIVFLADHNPDSQEVSKIFLNKGKDVISSEPLPGIEASWHISEVKALALDTKKSNDIEIQLLAIVNFYPPSGHKDSWDQAFVIRIKSDGKIFFDQTLNKKLGDKALSNKPIRTIKALKKFLSLQGRN